MKFMLPLIFLLGILPHKDTSENTYQLKINVTGIKSSKGNIRVALFNTEDSYKTESTTYKNAVVAAQTGQITITLENIKSGDYAVAIYHDSNSNGKLDKSVFGPPTEYYGFSNNARGSFGKPSYSQCRFTVTENKVIDIKLH